jgi:hypothetical protein
MRVRLCRGDAALVGCAPPGYSSGQRLAMAWRLRPAEIVEISSIPDTALDAGITSRRGTSFASHAWLVKGGAAGRAIDGPRRT